MAPRQPQQATRPRNRAQSYVDAGTAGAHAHRHPHRTHRSPSNDGAAGTASARYPAGTAAGATHGTRPRGPNRVATAGSADRTRCTTETCPAHAHAATSATAAPCRPPGGPTYSTRGACRGPDEAQRQHAKCRHGLANAAANTGGANAPARH
jgi:hypothetical protein